MHIGNVISDASPQDIIDYATEKGVEVYSCYKKTSWQAQTRKDRCVTAFRLCINRAFKDQWMEPDFWPHGVIAREWISAVVIIEN